MQTVTWKDWCEIKKQRDRIIEEQASKLTVKKCKCGGWYSFVEDQQVDPKRCAACRNQE